MSAVKIMILGDSVAEWAKTCSPGTLGSSISETDNSSLASASSSFRRLDMTLAIAEA